MQISCERCGTTYALDERLIPAGGAPVQCTRCGHVFTAYPPHAASPPPPSPSKDAHRTMMFGGSSGVPMPGAAPAASASRPPAPPPPAPPDRPGTQMFGTAATAVPAAAPPAPAPSERNHTQMFGGGAAATAGPDDTIPGNPAQPWLGMKPRAPSGPMQIQGAPGAGGSRSTQMFGSVAAAAASAPVAAGGPKPVFAGGQLPAAPPPEQREPTQMFGSVAPAPVPASQSAPRSSTQMFGGLTLPGTGGPPPGPSTPQKATQAYGGPTPPGAGPSPAPPRTSPTSPMFAAVSAPADPPTPSDRAPTQLWTNPNSPGGGAPPKPTQMFGMEAVDQQAPTPVPSLATTQLFGGIPGTPVPEPALPKILSSTPAPLPDESFADTVIRDRNRQPDPSSAARTQMFGAPDEEDLDRAWKGRSQQKSRFGVPDTTQPDAGGPPKQGRADPTTIPEQPFGPGITPLDLPELDGSTPLDTPAASRAATPSDLPQDTPAASRLELPPETPELVPEPRTEESGAGVDDAVALRRQLQRRTRIAVIGVGVAFLVIVGGIVGRLVVNRRNALPPDAIARLESARLLMRRDDVSSRNRAVTELTVLTAAYPEFVPAHAELVVALSLQLDDARIQVRRLTEEADDLHRRIARLSEEKSPSDWQNRVTVMQAKLAEIAALTNPLNEKSGTIDTELNDRFLALQSTQPNGIDDQKALTRAQAVYSGVKGSDTAIALAERYRNLGGTDGWASVALAELALNARVSPEAMTSAHAEMDELAAKDSTFLRSYVLSARLSLAQKHGENAVAGLEAVLALNPGHEIARQLLEWARSGEPER